MAETLEGKVVLITGASGRIGLGMAQAFHAAGALVALGDLRQDTVERASADLGGKRAFAGAVDVRDASSVRNFFAAAERALGPVDIAVANAGVFPTLAVLNMEVEEWDRDRDQSARNVSHVPSGGAKHGGWQAPGENHHDLLRRSRQRPPWWRALLRLEGRCRHVHQSARHGAGGGTHQRELHRSGLHPV